MSDYIELREPYTGRLLAKLDAQRGVLEFVVRNRPTMFDLTQYGMAVAKKKAKSDESESTDK